MKTYAIIDKVSAAKPIGFLFCFEKSGNFIIELQKGLDEWEAPLLFQGFIRDGVYTIPQDVSLLWVKERIIPSGRQNIGLILKNANLTEYNELRLLDLSKGKCSQDDCYLKEIAFENIDPEIKGRMKQTVKECFTVNKQTILCLFKDNTVKKISLKKLQTHCPEISKILNNDILFHSVKVGPGGYSIDFGGVVSIPVTILRSAANEEPVLAEDFYFFVKNNIINTTAACEILECSRQNLAYLASAKKLEPIVNGFKENLYTKGEINLASAD